MPIVIPTIKRCPITKNTQGIIEIEPWILNELASAVKDEKEWLIVLLGTREQRGLHIIVDDFYVPPTQHRTGNYCRPYKENFPDSNEDFPEEVENRTVASLHSHNSMRASFSFGDLADDGICSTLAPASIVIGSTVGQSREYIHLGFEYSAQGTYDLPCGAQGVCEFFIVPRGIKDWPYLEEIERPWIFDHSTRPLVTIETNHEDLGDCSEYSKSNDSNRYEYKRNAHCGLVETVFNIIPSVFGSRGRKILNVLPKPYEPPKKEVESQSVVRVYSSDDQDYGLDMDRWRREMDVYPDNYDYLAQYYAERYGEE